MMDYTSKPAASADGSLFQQPKAHERDWETRNDFLQRMLTLRNNFVTSPG